MISNAMQVTSQGLDSEPAISAVRGVLATLAIVVVGSTEALSHGFDVTKASGATLILGAGAVVLHFAWSMVGRVAGSRGEQAIVALHVVDTLWFVGLTFVLGASSAPTAWAILVIPTVIASLRLRSLGVLATWLIAGVAYLVAARALPGDYSGSGQELAERLAFLLAIAAAIALLTRWLSEGWTTQAALTRDAEQHTQWLETVETAARSMRSARPERITGLCLSAVLGLGFKAATASRGDDYISSTGDGSLVPEKPFLGSPAASAIDLIHWQGSLDRSVHSASCSEPANSLVITGWSTDPISDNQAQALGDLVAAPPTQQRPCTYSCGHATKPVGTHSPDSRTVPSSTKNSRRPLPPPAHSPSYSSTSTTSNR